jgi:hypothetical protein
MLYIINYNIIKININLILIKLTLYKSVTTNLKLRATLYKKSISKKYKMYKI